MHSGLFVAHEDVADFVLLEQRIIDRQHRAAGIAEYHLHPKIGEGLNDDFRAAEQRGRHDRLPNVAVQR